MMGMVAYGGGTHTSPWQSPNDGIVDYGGEGTHTSPRRFPGVDGVYGGVFIEAERE